MGSGLAKDLGTAGGEDRGTAENFESKHGAQRSKTFSGTMSPTLADDQSENREQKSDEKVIENHEPGETTTRSEPASPHSSNSPRSPRQRTMDSMNVQIQFEKCLEVLHTCDEWSEEERNQFVQKIKEEKLDFLVDVVDGFGNTLLILATMGYQVEVVDLLLQHGAEPDHQNSAGFCAMHYCSANPMAKEKLDKAYRVVCLLSKYGGNPNLIEATAGCTPLHYAASENNRKICDVLIENGASVTLRCKNGFLPEAYARASGHNDLADYLHEKVKKSVSQQVKAKIARQEHQGGHAWKQHVCSETGKFYYFNHRTGKSTWDRPVEMDILDSIDSKKSDGSRSSDISAKAPNNPVSFEEKSAGEEEKNEANIIGDSSPSYLESSQADEIENKIEEEKSASLSRNGSTRSGLVCRTPSKCMDGSEKDLLSQNKSNENESVTDISEDLMRNHGEGKECDQFKDTQTEQEKQSNGNEGSLKVNTHIFSKEGSSKKLFTPRTPSDSPVERTRDRTRAPNQSEPDLEKLQLKKQLEEMQKRLEEAQLRVKREAAQNERLRKVAKEADAKFERELEAMKQELRDKELSAEEKEKRIHNLKAEFDEAKGRELERLKMQFEKERLVEISKLEEKAREERERHEAELLKRMDELQNMEEQLQKELKEKKMYFNQVEELKGAIRVCARVRPLSQREIDRGCTNVLEVFGNNIKLTTRKKSNAGDDRVENKTWAFDKCLGPSRGQLEVFEDSERLIQSAVDGYNVCIFAYGQTGAGKTHTMSGPEEDPGILPRAVEELFKVMERNQAHYDFTLELYMCELHLDTLVDLLTENNNKDYTNAKTAFQIKKDQFGVVKVENITILPVDNKEDLLRYVKYGESRRSTDSTNMNDTSSRSHLVISVIVKSESKMSGEITSGKLTLVDLAGSERVAKSGAEGQTFKEATSINKALSALGEVINALTTNSKHVPYRNNPLTQLMSDSIGGNAKTLMIVNVSPADYNVNETIASLNFASRCKAVKNAASKGFETKEIALLRKEIAKLRRNDGGMQ